MKGIVADASLVVKYMFEEEDSALAISILENSEDVVAPDLVFAECGNVIWKRARRGGLTLVQAHEALRMVHDLSLQALPLGDLTADALRISLAFDHPIYDCYYVAATIQSGHTLVTADRVLAKLARDAGLDERVVLLGEDRG